MGSRSWFLIVIWMSFRHEIRLTSIMAYVLAITGVGQSFSAGGFPFVISLRYWFKKKLDAWKPMIHDVSNPIMNSSMKRIYAFNAMLLPYGCWLWSNRLIHKSGLLGDHLNWWLWSLKVFTDVIISLLSLVLLLQNLWWWYWQVFWWMIILFCSVEMSVN